MKKIIAFFSILAVAVLLVACGGGEGSSSSSSQQQQSTSSSQQQTTNIFEEEIVADVALKATGSIHLTTFGQAEWDYAQTLVEYAEIDANVSNTLTASQVATGDTVIAVVGWTSKGIAGDITQAGEKTRAEAFAAKAQANEIKLVIIHLGGEARRGESSDPIISAVVPHADVVLIEAYGNEDSAFNTWVGSTVPLYMYDDATVGMIESLAFIGA